MCLWMYSLFIQCLATVLQKHLWTKHPIYLENHLSCDQYSTDVKVAFNHRLFETQRNSNKETFIFKLELHWSEGGQPFPPSKRTSQHAVKLFKKQTRMKFVEYFELRWPLSEDLYHHIGQIVFCHKHKIIQTSACQGLFQTDPYNKMHSIQLKNQDTYSWIQIVNLISR